MLIQLKFPVPEYREILIVRLGEFHISTNFLGVIGSHINESGLTKAWTESKMLGPLKAEKALAMMGREYNYQALWRLLYPQFLQFLESHNPTLRENLYSVQLKQFDEIMVTVSSDDFQSSFDEFFSHRIRGNVNYEYWWGYMEMVSILLQFIRSQRAGDLHIRSFTSIIKYLMRYDHQNYARCGPVYVTEMHQLPDEIVQLFKQGHFIV